MKTVTIEIPEDLYRTILNSADKVAERPDPESEEYQEWYENRTHDGGNFDDCYENGLHDGYADFGAEIYHRMKYLGPTST